MRDFLRMKSKMFGEEKLKKRVKDLEARVKALEQPHIPQLMFIQHKQEVKNIIDERLIVFEAELKKIFVEQISQVYKEIKGSKIPSKKALIEEVSSKVGKHIKDELREIIATEFKKLQYKPPRSKKAKKKADGKREQYLS